jgi:bisphosphoglycerate-dependent phosphoglycerate mutase
MLSQSPHHTHTHTHTHRERERERDRERERERLMRERERVIAFWKDSILPKPFSSFIQPCEDGTMKRENS